MFVYIVACAIDMMMRNVHRGVAKKQLIYIANSLLKRVRLLFADATCDRAQVSFTQVSGLRHSTSFSIQSEPTRSALKLQCSTISLKAFGTVGI